MSNFLINSLKILFELSNEKIIENRQKFAFLDFWLENSEKHNIQRFLAQKFIFFPNSILGPKMNRLKINRSNFLGEENSSSGL